MVVCRNSRNTHGLAQTDLDTFHEETDVSEATLYRSFTILTSPTIVSRSRNSRHNGDEQGRMSRRFLGGGQKSLQARSVRTARVSTACGARDGMKGKGPEDAEGAWG